jgi:hypothetical protein
LNRSLSGLGMPDPVLLSRKAERAWLAITFMADGSQGQQGPLVGTDADEAAFFPHR